MYKKYETKKFNDLKKRRKENVVTTNPFRQFNVKLPLPCETKLVIIHSQAFSFNLAEDKPQDFCNNPQPIKYGWGGKKGQWLDVP